MILKQSRYILLALAVVAMIAGLFLSGNARREKRHDPARIEAHLTAKKVEYHPDESPYTNGCYYIYFDVALTNNTAETLDYVSILTTVRDKDGNELGTVRSEFGSVRAYAEQSGVLSLASGHTVTKQTSLRDNSPSDFFAVLYTTPFDELKFSCKIQSASFSDGYYYSGGS